MSNMPNWLVPEDDRTIPTGALWRQWITNYIFPTWLYEQTITRYSFPTRLCDKTIANFIFPTRLCDKTSTHYIFPTWLYEQTITYYKTIKRQWNPTKRDGLVQSGYRYPLFECTLPSPWYGWTIPYLALSNNHSLTLVNNDYFTWPWPHLQGWLNVLNVHLFFMIR